MPSLLTRMATGQAPASFVWEDDRCAAVACPTPRRPGHVILFPLEEIDDWLDVPEGLLGHLLVVAQALGRAVARAHPCAKVGLQVIGLEVRHVHLHLVPIDAATDLAPGASAPRDAAALEATARSVRRALEEAGLRPSHRTVS